MLSVCRLAVNVPCPCMQIRLRSRPSCVLVVASSIPLEISSSIVVPELTRARRSTARLSALTKSQLASIVTYILRVNQGSLRLRRPWRLARLLIVSQADLDRRDPASWLQEPTVASHRSRWPQKPPARISSPVGRGRASAK